MKYRIGLAGLAILGSVTLAACGSGSSSSGSAALHSLAANPTYSAEVAQLEAQLLANFKKDFSPAHPITSMESAVRDTFPGGSSTKIVNYALKTFTLKDAHGHARQVWIQGVVTYALNQGATGVGTGQPVIPGTTGSASPSSHVVPNADNQGTASPSPKGSQSS